MGVERRVHPRYEVVAQVELEANDEMFMLPLKNISRGGALLGLPPGTDVPELDLGEEVSAFVDFGSDALGDNLALSLEAEVVRVLENDGAPFGVALRWTGGSPFAQKRLIEIIEQLEAAQEHEKEKG